MTFVVGLPMARHWLGGHCLGVSQWLPHRTFAHECGSSQLPTLLPNLSIPVPKYLTTLSPCGLSAREDYHRPKIDRTVPNQIHVLQNTLWPGVG